MAASPEESSHESPRDRQIELIQKMLDLQGPTRIAFSDYWDRCVSLYRDQGLSALRHLEQFMEEQVEILRQARGRQAEEEKLGPLWESPRQQPSIFELHWRIRAIRLFLMRLALVGKVEDSEDLSSGKQEKMQELSGYRAEEYLCSAASILRDDPEMDRQKDLCDALHEKNQMSKGKSQFDTICDALEKAGYELKSYDFDQKRQAILKAAQQFCDKE